MVSSLVVAREVVTIAAGCTAGLVLTTLSFSASREGRTLGVPAHRATEWLAVAVLVVGAGFGLASAGRFDDAALLLAAAALLFALIALPIGRRVATVPTGR